MAPQSPDRRQVFRTLHESGCFVMPNPWDIGTARVLAQIGFPAIATTSAGLAWSLGQQDNCVSLTDTVRHLETIAQSVDVPVNADFESGFAIMPIDVAKNVSAAVTTGVAGLSIEDSSGDEANPLFDFELAVDRIRAARTAIDASGAGVILTARSEGFIVGRPALAQTIRRLTAYAEVGADCLYAPGIREKDDIVAVVRAVAPKPVNYSSAVTSRPLRNWQPSASGGSASVVHWPAPRGATSSMLPRKSQSTGRSGDCRLLFPFPCSIGGSAPLRKVSAPTYKRSSTHRSCCRCPCRSRSAGRGIAVASCQRGYRMFALP